MTTDAIIPHHQSSSKYRYITMATIHSLPVDLILMIAHNLSLKCLLSLYRTSRHIHKLLAPTIQDIALEDKNGVCALLWAALNGHEPLVRLVLDKGSTSIDIESGSRGTALHRAAGSGHERVVRTLIEKGIDVNIVESVGSTTALHWAALKGHEETVRVLIESGADVTLQDAGQETALHWPHAAARSPS
ncbi:uncharacterized protein LAJ45_04379 [Morchella importuna]|uniref:uncharacterized protein n=1 Tax=Morchella importuna TaxID=1174673 RepID=UPI001E8D7CA5|nr:uncharacterized protein LAJ45_04379 [Morchella importuna]KAH8151757.1 hypothetical protein LAJ45_04379 [Morchella importuna]